ncbi:MAG: protein-glutamate O-methyltransferase CheR [Nitrospiraceae bacterium]|nr:MAG: protein-glutamate O-methyltransferase CheR [Nitrospiraceae bacterium]
MKPEISKKEYELFRGFFEDQFGLALKHHSREQLAKLLEPHVKRLKMKSFIDYFNLISKKSTANKELIRTMTAVMNTESYFLREQAQFTVFLDLLNKMKKQKLMRSDRSIRILSAGSAAGQEPYSISLCINSSGTPLSNWDITIYGMDINPEQIAKAKKGIYNAYALRGLGKNVIQRYFDSINKNSYQLHSEIMKYVHYVRGNLMDPKNFQGRRELDIIFCRNVLIYMSNRAVNRVISNFWEALCDRGFLFIGQSESLMRHHMLFKRIKYPEVTVYQKMDPEILTKKKI